MMAPKIKDKILDQWKLIKLGALADYINGYAFKPSQWSQDGLQIIRIEQLRNPSAHSDYYQGKLPETYLINNGDLIFSWSASLFLRIWNNGQAYLNQHLFKVQERRNIDRIYLKYLIEFNLEGLVSASHGSTMRHITRPNLLNFEVLVPTSKVEQKTTVQILATLDEAIDKTDQLIKKNMRVKQGLMQDLFRYGIDEKGQIRSEKTHPFKDSPLGRIPEQWEMDILRNLLVGPIKNGYFKKPDLTGRGYKLINVSDLYQDFGINIDHIDRVDAPGKEYSKNEVLEGDCFFTRSSLVLEGIAQCNIARQLNESTIFECHVMRARPNRKRILPEFLAHWCRSGYARKYFMSMAKQVTMTTIDQAGISGMQIPVPARTEQKRIIDAMDLVAMAIENEETYKQKLLALRRGLMEDLLSGTVRVNHLIKE